MKLVLYYTENMEDIDNVIICQICKRELTEKCILMKCALEESSTNIITSGSNDLSKYCNQTKIYGNWWKMKYYSTYLCLPEIQKGTNEN